MRDLRLERLAEVLLTHSLKLIEGEKLYIMGEHSTKPLVKEVLQKAYEMGVIPYYELGDQELFPEAVAVCAPAPSPSPSPVAPPALAGPASLRHRWRL